MISRVLLAAAIAAWAIGAQAEAKTQRDPSRGELLYTTHCIACHTEQVHWRDKKLARDWTSLRLQVRRWQGNAALGWNNADVAEVTRYLNTRYYHFQPPV